jgi:hypothetical protein
MGANVLHEDSIFPVRQAGIPIHIRNTNRPTDPGTLIVNRVPEGRSSVITGVAGRKGFTFIMVEKAMMNTELGFGRRVLSVLEDHGISFEYMPTGIDTLSVVVYSSMLDGLREQIIEEINEACDPDHLELVEEALGSGNDAGQLGALARFLLEGSGGVPCYEKGIYYLRRAMDQNPIYYSLMAEYYKQDWLDPSEQKQRRKFWLDRGAEAGSTTCMAILAEYYGVPGPNYDPSWSRFWAKECFGKSTMDNEKQVAAYYLSFHSETESERVQLKTIYNGLK